MINVIECTIDLTCKSGNPVRQLFEKFLSMALRIYIKAAEDALEAVKDTPRSMSNYDRACLAIKVEKELPVKKPAISLATKTRSERSDR